MSGHSKWNNIKRKKEATDAAKGKIFTKIGREIMVCVKESGPDPNSNSKLRDLIAKAKANNVPNDNIDRVIKKAAGGDDKNSYESMVYEGYGPNGVAVIVECLTDNKNRTAGDVRHYFDKFGGNLGTSGCVSFMFSGFLSPQFWLQLLQSCVHSLIVCSFQPVTPPASPSYDIRSVHHHDPPDFPAADSFS